MGAMASQIISLTSVNSTVYSCEDQRKHRSPASLAFVRGIHQWPVNSPHIWPVTRKMFLSDDVTMCPSLPVCLSVSLSVRLSHTHAHTHTQAIHTLTTMLCNQQISGGTPTLVPMHDVEYVNVMWWLITRLLRILEFTMHGKYSNINEPCDIDCHGVYPNNHTQCQGLDSRCGLIMIISSQLWAKYRYI